MVSANPFFRTEVSSSFPLVGVTTRLLRQAHTADVHDALSQDWGRFLAAAGVAWVPLPNRGEETLHLAKRLDLGGFIFSGGGEAGGEPLRDATEALLLHHAQKHGLPVLGVCRGFQAIQLFLKGTLVSVGGHVATCHALYGQDAETVGQRVNSFHNNAIAELAAPLRPLAFSCEPDGTRHVEAAWSAGLLGIMWHPERAPLPHAKDVALVRHFLAFPAECPPMYAGNLSGYAEF